MLFNISTKHDKCVASTFKSKDTMFKYKSNQEPRPKVIFKMLWSRKISSDHKIWQSLSISIISIHPLKSERTCHQQASYMTYIYDTPKIKERNPQT